MVSEPQPAPSPRGRAVREVVVYGLACGVLIALVKLVEARFLAVESSFGLYGGLLALLFAGVGIWLGARRRTQAVTIGRESQLIAPVTVDPAGHPKG